MNLRPVPSRILLLEPDTRLADSVQSILVLNGYACAVSPTPVEADQAMAHEEFDLLLADLQMPNLAERGTLYAAGARHVGTVVMTSTPTLESALEGIRMGVLDYLVKPFSFDDLLSRLAAALAKRQARQEDRHAGSFPRTGRTGRFADNGDWDRLSRREREVVSELVAGLKVGDIATRMSISENTIRNHLRSVFAKLRVSSQAQLIQKLAPMLGSSPRAQPRSN